MEASKTATEDLGTAITDAGTDTTNMTSDATTAFGEVKAAIVGTGEEVTNLNTKIIEIPSQKSIELTLTNYATSMSKIDKFKKSLQGISNITVNLKVKAGLTAGARNFLKQLKDIDSDIASDINQVLNLSQFAKGGFPRSGELFIANENGRQELVGRIGNRSAVANQDQIGDAIFKYMDAHGSQNGGMSADALATAIAGALKAAGIGTVTLDGRMLSQSINRESQRIGRPAINF